MRRFPRNFHKSLFLLIILSLIVSACSLPSILSSPQEEQIAAATPTAIVEQSLPPDVVETMPLKGSRIGLQEPIAFYFNQPMDRVSVESAWVADPAVAGNFVWADDATLTFTPNQPLEAGASLNLGMSTAALSSKGIALSESLNYSFNAADFLHPVQFLPKDGSVDLSVDSAVVVTFDQPVVPLGADSSTLPAAFTLEPAAQGHGEWSNTSTYIFYPEPAFAGGQVYRAILNVDLRSVAGTALEDVTSWSFTTALPRLLDISPSTEIPLPLDLEWTFTFNQPMDAASVEANFSLLGNEGAVAGSFDWAEDARSVTFIADELLTRDSSYRFLLSGVTQAQGGTPLGTDWDVEVYSSPNFELISTDPVQGGVTNEYGSGHIYFSTDVEEDDIEDYLKISPEISSFNANVHENAIHFSGNFAHETSYTLTLSSALKDRWGQELGSGFSYSFSKPAPAPKITLPYIGSPFYFSSAANPLFYIQSTNISQADLSLGEVPLVDFFKLFGPNSYDLRKDYLPESAVSWRQNLDIEKNKSETFALGLAASAGSLKTGIHSLIISEEDTPNYIIASDVNLVFKFSATDALVWATDLETNAPIAGEALSIYDETGTLIASGTTDATGMWHGTIPAQKDSYQNYYAMLGQIGEENFGFGSSVWGEDISPWRFALSADYRPPHTEVYLYTDRPIYRPGQTVYFRAIVREAYDGRYDAPTLTSLPLTVSNGWGDNIHTLNPALSEYGAAHASFTIPADSKPGYFSFFNQDLEFSTSFQVADYRKPEINLELEMTPTAIKKGESLSAEISARYYFDAPASDLNISWALYDDNGYFRLPGYRVGELNLGWLRGEYDNYGYFGGRLAEGEGITNAEGFLKLNLDTLDIADGTRELTLEITAQDESGQQISARTSTLAHPETSYIGLRPDLWVGREETEMGFDVLTVDWHTDPLAAQNLHADFQQVTWERQDADNAYDAPTYTPVYTPVSDVDLVTGNDGAARLSFTPPTPGTYILEVSGGNASTQVMLWVRGAAQAIWPNLPNQHIRLTADKDSYNPGDTAEIFIPNPLDAATQALVTVERGTIHKSEIINVEPGGATYSLPLTNEDAPTVYFSAMLLGGRDFRVGYAEIEVSAAAQILNVNLTSQPSRSEPGGEVNFGIVVTDSQGAPVQGEFSLAVVDLAALALADPNSEPIETAFYDKARLGVRTSISMSGDSVYGIFLDFGGGRGGGGGEDVSVVRDNFPDTAYWNAEIITDINGQAQVSVVLPDNLTTWHVDLRGLTKDTRVGSAEMQVVSTKDVLIRPVTPRFLVVGDHVEMAAIVHNNTAGELSGRVTLQAIGFLLDDANMIEQQVTVPAGGRVKVSWWGVAQDAEVAELLFNSVLGNYQDITRPSWGSLPILRYTSPQSFVSAGTLETESTLTESISLPRSFIPSGGKLDVTLDPSLVAAILDGLEAIPAPASTSSNEAILSYLLPNLAAYKALQSANLNDADLEARLNAALRDGVRRLLNSQNEDHGWGWYATPTTNWTEGIGALASPTIGGGGDLKGDPYLTAYILFGLWQVHDAGVPDANINETVFINAREYLHTASLPYIAGVNLATWEKDRLAFIQYVMQMTGGADAVAVDQLDLWREELSPWAQALLALTLESRTAGDARASSLLANLESSARRSASGAHWESDATSWRNPGTPNYTTATIIYALAQFDATNPLVNDAVRYLSAHRNIHGYWHSTYESAWSLLALTEVAKNANEFNASFTYFADLNGDMLASGQANALTPVTTTTLLDGLQLALPNALNITRGEGVGRLYYRAALFADRAAETAPALNQGMEVSRIYYDADCEKDCPPLDGAKLTPGARVKVQITLSIADDSYYLMLEDHIPAGAEILNQQLKTSQLGVDADSVQLYDPDNPFADGWGWWYFSAPQIGDENIRWAADYLPAGTYVLSYTIIPLQAGEYRVLPAHAWQSYFPEVQGASAGELFVVRE
ncbi:MAG: hypothetical protein HN560_12400 [Anaerolineae bacterium]|nr:hypothetical protein [Anaerolineae bacterium]